MKLTLNEFVTLDGVMQGPGAAEEDVSDGFAQGGWLVPFADEEFGEIVGGWFSQAEAILLGRTTYELMFPYWSQVTDPDNPAGVALNALPKHVVTSDPDELTWQNSERIDGSELIEAVTALKDRPGGELQVHGSAQLAATLHEAGLVDVYRLLQFPVSVGAGKRLFTDEAPPTGFAVAASRTTAAGVSYLELTPAPFTSGTVEVADGREVV